MRRAGQGVSRSCPVNASGRVPERVPEQGEHIGKPMAYMIGTHPRSNVPGQGQDTPPFRGCPDVLNVSRLEGAITTKQHLFLTPHRKIVVRAAHHSVPRIDSLGRHFHIGGKHWWKV